MLLPSLQKARATVKASVCISNLKQLSTWGIAYSTDSDEILPSDGSPSRSNYTDLSNTTWFRKYPGYVRLEPSGTAMHCPQATDSLRPRWQFQQRNDFDYGLNSYLGGRKLDWTPEIPRANLLTSDKYWFGDGKASESNSNGYYIWEYMDATLDNRTSWMWEYPDLGGHPKSMSNFTFGDGHVEARSNLSIISLVGDEKLKFRGTATE